MYFFLKTRPKLISKKCTEGGEGKSLAHSGFGAYNSWYPGTILKYFCILGQQFELYMISISR